MSAGFLLVVLGVLAGAAVLGIVWAKWDKKDEKRRAAFAEVAFVLKDFGLERIPNMLKAYSIGNFFGDDGFFTQVNKFADMLDDGNDVVIKEFSRVFDRVLDKKLSTAEGLAYVKARVSGVEQPAVTASAALAA